MGGGERSETSGERSFHEDHGLDRPLADPRDIARAEQAKAELDEMREARERAADAGETAEEELAPEAPEAGITPALPGMEMDSPEKTERIAELNAQIAGLGPDSGITMLEPGVSWVQIGITARALRDVGESRGDDLHRPRGFGKVIDDTHERIKRDKEARKQSAGDQT